MTNPFPPPQHVTPFILTTFAYHNSSLKRMTKIINNRKIFFFFGKSGRQPSVPLLSQQHQLGVVANLDLFILCSNTTARARQTWWQWVFSSTRNLKVQLTPKWRCTFFLEYLWVFQWKPWWYLWDKQAHKPWRFCVNHCAQNVPQISKNSVKWNACVWSTKGLNRLRLDLHCWGILT